MLVAGNFISYLSSKLHYAKGGNGPLPLILFHGFGQDHRIFNHWTDELGSTYTLYSIDLFFHGLSDWNENRALEKADWQIIMSLLMAKEKITRFAVAGYSLGGKFELAVIESFPEQITRVYFLAPDGILLNYWYRLATGSIVFRSLFNSMILRPGRFQDIVRVLKKSGIVHGGILRFAESQMDTEEKRRRVYHAWVVFRKLKFSMRAMAGILNKRSVPVWFIIGRFDKIIPPEKIAPLQSRLTLQQTVILETGHNAIVNEAAPLLLS